MSPNEGDVVDALRVTLKERDRLRKENALLLSGSSEPIAIVGMGCRYPRRGRAPRSSGDLVADGRGRRSSGFPRTAAGTSSASTTPTRTRPGTSYVREGGFLADAGRLRRRILRHQPARGARDRPAAAAAAGDVLGGARERRHRPGLAARQPDRRLRRRHVPRLRHADACAARRLRGLPRHRQRRQRRLRSRRLHPRPRGAGRHRRHRLLVLARGDAPRRPGAAPAASATWRWPAASP